jgi:pyruvate dehydrogenase E1 component alpha subunit
MKINKENSVAISYLGDGAMEEGVVHESLNLAKIFNLPVIFVVENNFFASHMHIDLRQCSKITSRFAISNNIPFASLDGNNIISIYEASKSLISSARNGGGPAFIEAFTFRHYGHVDWRTDIDVGVHRSEKDIKKWMSRDPILRLSMSMISARKIKEDEVSAMREGIQQKISMAWKAAELAPCFTSNLMLERVYQ